ncbi:(2,3-dihydroxybenzoyl)adenylate synthase [Gracilibacillus salinarum]|uniref:(2,3-dihydroxybenzoyl)adenylate synthase n=1 Tax=Gracilibacillus salinarum TaxID=2932255 RepID=A0ABY4GKL0_9BACI|nr:(2,3-dihydroxybenzoyl)adenylate synthase [Gracilibacillus salinarum]UOQ84822.1 (2,3-dihydroxybenzoyl)adenylate synthase [Gracilibacillus salinarum]
MEGCPTWPEELATYYREQGCWKGETFGEMLRKQAEQYPDRIVLTTHDEQVSYAQLQERVDQLAVGLQQLGIEKEDLVVVQLPNQIAFFEVIFALFNLGALPVFALPTHRISEIQYFCEFSEAKAYIVADKHAGYDYLPMAERVKEEVPTLGNVIVHGETDSFIQLADLYKDEPLNKLDVRPSDVAFLQLSGGSTGLSKLIPRTHDDYMYSLIKSNEVCEMTEDSVYLAVLPVAHNFPLSSPGVLGTICAGGRIVLSGGSSPDEAFPLIEKEKVTITGMVPPIALIWLEAIKSRSYDFSSLQVIQVGGAKFSAESAKRIRPAFGCQLQQVFGMAEGLVNYTRLDDPEETIIHTQGRPMSDYDEVRIVDEDDQEVAIGEVGELLTRGPYTIRGYYKAEQHNKKSFTDDGFYRTGDLVRRNEDGSITVEGRDKDQINRGGEKIAAEEVENHLLAHPSVYDAAIVSMPDHFLGERSCAFIIPKGEQQTTAVIRTFLEKRGLATYKIPDRVEWVESFPQTALGKVSKKKLRQQISDKVRL